LTCNGYVYASDIKDDVALKPYFDKLVSMTRRAYPRGWSDKQGNAIAHNLSVTCVTNGNMSFETAAKQSIASVDRPASPPTPQRRQSSRMGECYSYAESATREQRIMMQCGWNCSQMQQRIYQSCMGYH
jgi:hypothetical protein